MKRSWSKLVKQGGQPYWAFPFSKASLLKLTNIKNLHNQQMQIVAGYSSTVVQQCPHIHKVKDSKPSTDGAWDKIV